MSVRIIPARAGFTLTVRWQADREEDHPRSRGVYGHGPSCAAHYLGSSPLARGLRMCVSYRGGCAGIIPARAGFTICCPMASGSGGGSSPLARGLRSRPVVRCALSRIIPARAGFTHVCLLSGRVCRDHPRSRGVYHLLSDGKRIGRRIIPARAGFTLISVCVCACVRDHPRSRGVYGWGDAGRRLLSGSSPLARGLLGLKSAYKSCVRIIPARAGFTIGVRLAGRSATDHPRSRGVYRDATHSRPRNSGSSPLARGLRRGVAR